jgi:hypothetical protein
MIDLFTQSSIQRITTNGSFIEQYPEVKTVRALSWKNPYGWLMAEKDKIETRTWATNYRGWVLMCASLAAYKSEKVIAIAGPDHFLRIREATSGREAEIYSHRGKAFAIGYLADCRRMRSWDEDRCFVRYHEDLWCHVYTQVKWIDPFSWRGKQGWSTLTVEEIHKIKIAA